MVVAMSVRIVVLMVIAGAMGGRCNNRIAHRQGEEVALGPQHP